MEMKRVFDILDHCKEHFGDKEDVVAGKESGKWVAYSINQYIEQANNFSLGLIALGFEKGDKIISITNNRPEWNFIDMGMSQIGVIHIPVYPTISKDDYTYIFNHSNPKTAIVSDKATYDKISPIATASGIDTIYTVNNIAGIPNWNDICELGKKNSQPLVDELKHRKQAISTSDLFTIIFTSGTTGFPKGVMLSHSNIIQNVKETAKAHGNGATARALSFLPLSHIYERMINYHYQYKGISIYYAENMGTIADNLKEIKPQIFCSVPRILELFFEKIQSKGNDLPWLQKRIFEWALRLGMRYELNKPYRFWYRIKHKIANKLVYAKVREALGGKVNVVVSGGASLQTRLARVLWAADMQVIEGYGLTETSPVIAVNNVMPPMKVMFGTVGRVIDGVTVKIADDGEILCKGHNVMMGYYNQPQMTSEVIDNEGWFHTGDIGTFEKGMFLKITDRKKEIFKLSSGKYIAPQVLENKLKESVFIEQTIVVGENEKFASALIQPNFIHLQNWCAAHKIRVENNADMVGKPQVLAQFQKVVTSLNEQLGQTENIKRIKLVSETWSPLTGELSPTLKLKRKVIHAKYKDLIDQIYTQKGA